MFKCVNLIPYNRNSGNSLKQEIAFMFINSKRCYSTSMDYSNQQWKSANYIYINTGSAKPSGPAKTILF